MARLAVQVVAVLGDHVAQHAERLEFGHGVVPGVRPGGVELVHQVLDVGIALAEEPFLPPPRRVAQEALEAVASGLADLGPESALASERWYAGLVRNARAGERDSVRGTCEQIGGSRQCSGIDCHGSYPSRFLRVVQRLRGVDPLVRNAVSISTHIVVAMEDSNVAVWIGA